jgi:hypothetical protein
VASGLGLGEGPRLRQNLKLFGLGEVVGSSGERSSVARSSGVPAGAVGSGGTTAGRVASAAPLESLRRRPSDALCWSVWRMGILLKDAVAKREERKSKGDGEEVARRSRKSARRDGKSGSGNWVGLAGRWRYGGYGGRDA